MNERYVRNRKVALVAGSGGHLAQLSLLRREMTPGMDAIWVTDRTPQSESLLGGESVIWIPRTAPRNISDLLRNMRYLQKELPRDVDVAVSTGAGIAVSAALVMLWRGLKPLIYIESATRVTARSATARVLQFLPNVATYVQHSGLATWRWRYRRSVLDDFEVSARPRSSGSQLKIVVTVGANQQAGFERMIRAAYEVIPKGAAVTWQVGPSNVSDLPINASPYLPHHVLQEAVDEADVVISHAGTGSILSALVAGRVPIVIARGSEEGEHVDNHQDDLARYAEERGLAISRSSDSLSVEDLYLVADRTVITKPFKSRRPAAGTSGGD